MSVDAKYTTGKMKMICSLCKHEVKLSAIIIVDKHEYCSSCIQSVMDNVDSRNTLENALKTAIAIADKGNIPDDSGSGLE